MARLDNWAKKNAALRRAYLQIFGSHAGQVVLFDMLSDLDFPALDVVTEGQITRNNYARLLLFKIGMWDNEILPANIRMWIAEAQKREAIIGRKDRPSKS